MLSIQNITKTFGKRTALSQVSFAFDKKVYGLVGANGAGKTTLLRCFFTAVPPWMYPKKWTSVLE